MLFFVLTYVFLLQDLLVLLLGLGPVEAGIWLQAREPSLVFLVLLVGILWFLYNSNYWH